MTFIQLNKFEHDILTLMHKQRKMEYLVWDSIGDAMVFRYKPVWNEEHQLYTHPSMTESLDNFETLDEITVTELRNAANIGPGCLQLFWLTRNTGPVHLKTLLDATANGKVAILEDIQAYTE